MNKTALFALSLAAAAITFPAAALAQEEQPEVRYQAETHVEFDTQTLTGELAGPSISFTMETLRPGSTPFIRLRADFDAELENSTNQVR